MLKRNALYVVGAITTILLLLFLCIFFGTILITRSNSTVHTFAKTYNGPIENVDMCSYNIDDFKLIIDSIDRGLEFFSSELELDSGAGTRALQAQLQIILRNFTVPPIIRTQLRQLLRNVTYVGDRIVAHTIDTMEKDQSPTGRENLKQGLYWIKNESLWDMPAAGDWRERDAMDSRRYNIVDNNYVVYSGTNFSDSCIAAVFDDCTVPDECFSLFLRRRYSEYLITHSVLFLMVAKKRNCYDVKEYMRKLTEIGNPDDIMASLCAKIYQEAQKIEQSGFDFEYRDLFCEEVFVCSMNGFKQFLRPSWLRTILSWQNKNLLGCFALPKVVAEAWEETYGDVREIKRHKRCNNVIKMGDPQCHTHFTAVAIGYIAMHLRYMVEFCPETLFDAGDSN